MNFLEEDDVQEVLQVALAFIDKYADFSSNDSGGGSSSSNSPDGHFGSNGDDMHSMNSSDDDDEIIKVMAELDAFFESPNDARNSTPPVPTYRQIATTKRNIRAGKRFRAKREAEVASLRAQVAQLESKLNRMLLPRRIDNSTTHVDYQRMRSEVSGVLPTSDSEGARRIANLRCKTENQSFWLEIAAAQANERRRSQTLNAKL